MAAMSRQDFELIARVIRDQRADLPTEDMTDHGLDLVSFAFANALAQTNPRFDPERFLRACGVTS